MWERFWELLRWDFPKFYCESHNGAPFSDEVGENPGGSSEDWNLEPKKTNNRTKHARPHPQTPLSMYRTGHGSKSRGNSGCINRI